MRATRYELASEAEALELIARRGWGDGLPVVLPTPDRVEAMIAASGRDPDELLGTMAPSNAPVTVEKVAINVVLAGGAPEIMPVVLAAVEALLDPKWSLAGVQATTHPCGPLLIINGPAAAHIGYWSGAGALGPGSAANATTGRAVRFCMMNIGGAYPSREDRATQGHPGKYTYCFAENESESPWEPFHVSLGYGAAESTVTVLAAETPHNVNDHGATTPEQLLDTIAYTMATPGMNNVYLGGEVVVVLGPEHSRTVASSGWTRRQVQEYLFEKARVPRDRFNLPNIERFEITRPQWFKKRTDPVPVVDRPEDLYVMVAGGPGKHSQIIPTFGNSRAVTRRIKL